MRYILYACAGGIHVSFSNEKKRFSHHKSQHLEYRQVNKLPYTNTYLFLCFILKRCRFYYFFSSILYFVLLANRNI